MGCSAGETSLHRPPWMRSGEVGEVGGGGTAAPEAGPAESRSALGKEGGAGGAQLAQEHGVARGREEEKEVST